MGLATSVDAQVQELNDEGPESFTVGGRNAGIGGLVATTETAELSNQQAAVNPALVLVVVAAAILLLGGGS